MRLDIPPIALALALIWCGPGMADDRTNAVQKYRFPSPGEALSPPQEATALYYQYLLQNQLLDLSRPQGLEPPTASQQRQRLETGIELNRIDSLITNNRLGNR